MCFLPHRSGQKSPGSLRAEITKLLTDIPARGDLLTHSCLAIANWAGVALTRTLCDRLANIGVMGNCLSWRGFEKFRPIFIAHIVRWRLASTGSAKQLLVHVGDAAEEYVRRYVEKPGEILEDPDHPTDLERGWIIHFLDIAKAYPTVPSAERATLAAFLRKAVRAYRVRVRAFGRSYLTNIANSICLDSLRTQRREVTGVDWSRFEENSDDDAPEEEKNWSSTESATDRWQGQ